MLRLKKGLADMLEQDTNNNALAESPPQMADAQQAASAHPQTTSDSEWGQLLIKLLAAAPEDVAHKLVNCLDINLIAKMLEERGHDPYLKVALLLLKK